jgi:hypothetical protein
MLNRANGVDARMKTLRVALLTLLLAPAACSGGGDPLVGIFSAKMVQVGYGASTGQVARLRVSRKDDGYGLAIWNDQNKTWKETALHLKRCTFGDFAGQKSPELDAVVGACDGHTALFYSAQPVPKALAEATHTGYAFFLAVGMAGTIWEATKE